MRDAWYQQAESEIEDAGRADGKGPVDRGQAEISGLVLRIQSNRENGGKAWVGTLAMHWRSVFPACQGS